MNSNLSLFDELPNSALVNATVVKALNSNISDPTLWRRINAGLFPPPVHRTGPEKQGPREWTVAAPDKGGSYVKTTVLSECLEIIRRLDQFVKIDDIPDLQLQSW